MDFSLYFQICAEGFWGLFSCQSANCFTKCLVIPTKQSQGAPNLKFRLLTFDSIIYIPQLHANKQDLKSLLKLPKTHYVHPLAKTCHLLGQYFTYFFYLCLKPIVKFNKKIGGLYSQGTIMKKFSFLAQTMWELEHFKNSEEGHELITVVTVLTVMTVVTVVGVMFPL